MKCSKGDLHTRAFQWLFETLRVLDVEKFHSIRIVPPNALENSKVITASPAVLLRM
jgi:hypothetical protein